MGPSELQGIGGRPRDFVDDMVAGGDELEMEALRAHDSVTSTRGPEPDYVRAERREMAVLNDSVAGERFEVVTGNGRPVRGTGAGGICVRVNVVPVEQFGSRCCIPLHSIPRSAALLLCDSFRLDGRILETASPTYLVGALVHRQMERDDTLVLNIIRL